jgi:hypothetical protein
MNLMTKEKPYNTLNAYYRHRFGKKVFKVSLNGGFTCPNKDGSKGYGGCIYCSESGSGDFSGDKTQPLSSQFQTVKDMMEQKWKNGLYIAYFQANTNTYDTVDRLRKLYYEAINLDEKVIGLSIGTRPDAFNTEIYDLLEEINSKTFLQVELGLQTINEESVRFINRGHDLQCFTECVKELRMRNIDVVVHIINGLPNEQKEDMLHIIDFVNTLNIQGIKIHLLHIMKHTALGKLYVDNPFKTLTLEEYVDITVAQIERLDPNIIIHRLTGDSPRELLIEPLWSLKKFVVMNEIDKSLRSNHSYQGIHYKK